MFNKQRLCPQKCVHRKERIIEYKRAFADNSWVYMSVYTHIPCGHGCQSNGIPRWVPVFSIKAISGCIKLTRYEQNLYVFPNLENILFY